MSGRGMNSRGRASHGFFLFPSPAPFRNSSVHPEPSKRGWVQPRTVCSTLKAPMIPTFEWTSGGIRFLDQRRLPQEEAYLLATTYQEVAEAITKLVVRGAPAIGVAAAMGLALGVKNSSAQTLPALTSELEVISKTLAATRPTAVNLFWAIEHMRHRFFELAAQPGITLASIRSALIEEASSMYEEDIANCRAMGAHGAPLMPESGGVLTHCNAGALATCGYGTALGVIRAAVERGHLLQVYADETRPVLQGARLTAWELLHDNIPTTVLCDNMAASMMRRGKIQAVIVGADRVAANGDVANKIGTYGVAILAKEHGLPFYVACPWSTIDLTTPTGDAIVIEQRTAWEVTHHGGQQLTPDGAGIENPAFDVTPAQYVTAIITERGVLRAPYQETLAAGANIRDDFASQIKASASEGG
jgi:methylthioribose-1-phosphate isomerase